MLDVLVCRQRMTDSATSFPFLEGATGNPERALSLSAVVGLTWTPSRPARMACYPVLFLNQAQRSTPQRPRKGCPLHTTCSLDALSVTSSSKGQFPVSLRFSSGGLRGGAQLPPVLQRRKQTRPSPLGRLESWFFALCSHFTDWKHRGLRAKGLSVYTGLDRQHLLLRNNGHLASFGDRGKGRRGKPTAVLS